ncbi:PDZ domain-containing protein [uncultured Lacticaseibacillus sp.]|uniref:PDZ domain-containing protein n=1 Tax=uncultured Lacticaseibacillus sp. TaxID=2775882 RepID=UPI00259A542F|nr:PDZ domain-containing protein [uncultured Lacticaseibacillus sp.]
MGVIQFDLLFLASTILIALVVRIRAGRRLQHERAAVRLAVTRDLLEEGYYWLATLLPGILISVLLIVLGVTIPTAVGITFAALALIMALVMPGFSPLYLGLVGAIVWAIPHGWWSAIGLPSGTPAKWAPGTLLIVGLALLVNAYTAWRGHRPVSSPRVVSRGGQTWARYRVRQLLWLPLILPVPGTWLAALPWWPHLGLGLSQGHFALLALPLFLGFGFTHQQAKSRPALVRTAWVEGVVGLATVITAAFVYADVVKATPVILGVALLSLGALVTLWVLRRSHPEVTLGRPGVRVVGVVADTPAARMGLVPGDVVLQCNGADVTDTASLYNASQHLGTFCRLRVQDTAGEFRLVETAIYTGTPHLLGIITFPED